MQTPFSESYLGKLRHEVGNRLLQVPAFRAVIENNEGYILLQKRRDFGVWGLPGGHPEENESMPTCAFREIFEETGLETGDYLPFGYSSVSPLEITTYPNGDIIHSFCLLILVRQWKGNMIAENSETLELKFFSVGALPEMLPNEKNSLFKYLEYKKSGLFQFS